LENAGLINEIKTSTWVSNRVIVPKKNTEVQRICVDYTSLNKHCPKDPFPLPRIDQIIDSTAGLCKAFLLGHIFWLQPDQIENGRQRKNGVHHTVWSVLLSNHAFWFEKRGSNLPAYDAKLPWATN
jgi:hypothetical protein